MLAIQMRIASDLGMTLKQLADNMTKQELTLWIARYMLEHEAEHNANNSIGARAEARLRNAKR
jgi:hypothetical protein